MTKVYTKDGAVDIPEEELPAEEINKIHDNAQQENIEAQGVFTSKHEIMPNGKYRIIKSVNSDNELTITVDANAYESLKTINSLFNSDFKDVLKLVDTTTGEVIAEYESALLTSNNFMQAIQDNSGTNAQLVFNCVNSI